MGEGLPWSSLDNLCDGSANLKLFSNKKLLKKYKRHEKLSKTMLDVVTFLGCHNKVPQTGVLKTTEVYALTVLETRSLK